MTPVLIVSHGQPSDPGPAEARLAAFGRQVAARLAGQAVHTVTLAAPGGLDRVVAGFEGAPFLAYPMFMSDGWFVSTRLPDRLRAAGGSAHVLPPFGLDPALPDLVRRTALAAIREQGMEARATTVLLTAHGSPRDPRPRRAARAQAAALTGAVKAVRFGFVDEAPGIEQMARIDGPAITLPLFAATNGHVRQDVAAALDRGGFDGPRLPPIGEHAHAPVLVAHAITCATHAAA